MAEDKLKTIAIIIPYYGKLPANFNTFLESAKINSTIDFYIYTDQEIDLDETVKNIYVIQSRFDDIKELIQSKFSFHVCLEKPYKLCDFKPAYGYIFGDVIKNYDYWGYCDIDLILGDLRAFLTKDVLDKYDRFYQFGHLSVYRNTNRINTAFMMSGNMDYQEVFTTPTIWVFDELQGIQSQLDEHGFKTYKKLDFADITPRYFKFKRAVTGIVGRISESHNEKLQLFYYQNGKVYRAVSNGTEVINQEFVYIHFQKRKLNFESEIKSIPNRFLVTPYGFKAISEYQEINKSLIKKYNNFDLINELRFRIRFYAYLWKRRWNKYVLNR